MAANLRNKLSMQPMRSRVMDLTKVIKRADHVWIKNSSSVDDESQFSR